MLPADDFSQWLRRLRTARDLTQEMLAETTGCTSQTIRSNETGRRRPSREMAARLADALAVPPNERDSFLRSARASVAATNAAGSDDIRSKPAAVFGRQSNISVPADALIGRHDDLKRLCHALLEARQRLVTLLGPGGIGKTRLALQTATDLAPTSPMVPPWSP